MQTPESIQIDTSGSMYVSLALTGEVRRIDEDGTQETLAYLPLHPEIVPCGNAFGLPIMGGLALDHQGNIYVSVVSCDTGSLGVWKVTQSGQASLLANLPAHALWWAYPRLLLASVLRSLGFAIGKLPGLAIDEFSRVRMDATHQELLEERDGVKDLI